MPNDDKRRGLMVRKLAAEDGTGLYHRDHITGEPALRPLKGVVFADELGRKHDLDGNAHPAPRLLRLPTDYVLREAWIELVNQRGVVKPSGPASNPWNGQQAPHTFVHCDEVILHMIDPDTEESVDYRYRVTHQPDKYDTPVHEDGVTETACDNAGDPTTHVDHFYDLDLIEES